MMQYLFSPDFQECIAWRYDGKAFNFLDWNKFLDKIATGSTESYQTMKKSFIRKLNRWGFRMDVRKGLNYGMYSHKYFQRDKYWLCEKMVCGKELIKTSTSTHDCKLDINNETINQHHNEIGISNESTVQIQNDATLSIADRIYKLIEIDHKLRVTEALIMEKSRSLGYTIVLDGNR